MLSTHASVVSKTTASKEITPPLNVPAPVDTAPAQPAAAPSPSSVPPSGGAPSPSSSVPATQSPSKGKQAKAAKPKAPSTHQMQTRRRVTQHGGKTVVTPARPVTSQSEAIRLKDDMPMAEARAAWTLVTRKKKRVQFQTYQSPKELAAKALAAAALALKVQGASASSVDVMCHLKAHTSGYSPVISLAQLKQEL